MTTLIPEAPGHWTEAVLLAFPDAAITNDYPHAGVLHVTLSLAEDWEIEFRRDEFTLPDAPQSYSANLQSFDKDHHLQDEELLYEASDVDVVCEETRHWVERYYDMQAGVEALVAPYGTTKDVD